MKLFLIPTILATSMALSGCETVGSMGNIHQQGVHQQGVHQQDVHQQGVHQQGMHQMDGDHHDRMQTMHDTDAAAIDAAAILQAYSDTINIEDVDEMAALTVADERFSIIEGGHANWGWVDYRDNHLAPEFASERFQINTYGFSDINVRAGHLIAYATFSFAFEATLDGEPYNKEGLGTAVLRRTPDGWRITHLQTS